MVSIAVGLRVDGASLQASVLQQYVRLCHTSVMLCKKEERKKGGKGLQKRIMVIMMTKDKIL